MLSNCTSNIMARLFMFAETICRILGANTLIKRWKAYDAISSSWSSRRGDDNLSTQQFQKWGKRKWKGSKSSFGPSSLDSA